MIDFNKVNKHKTTDMKRSIERGAQTSNFSGSKNINRQAVFSNGVDVVIY
jgi:hypothetical protein